MELEHLFCYLRRFSTFVLQLDQKGRLSTEASLRVMESPLTWMPNQHAQALLSRVGLARRQA